MWARGISRGKGNVTTNRKTTDSLVLRDFLALPQKSFFLSLNLALNTGHVRRCFLILTLLSHTHNQHCCVSGLFVSVSWSTHSSL